MLYAEVVAQLRAAGCVFAEDEAIVLIDAATPDNLPELVARRVGGDPLEHIVGWAEFAGLRIMVGPGVFVPRRRTELLALRAAALATPGATVVDLCCGSGAVGAVVRALTPSIELYAADAEPAAVRCARRNLGERVYQGDLYDALPPALRGSVDVLVANAPYVPTGDIALMPPEARDHEPRVSLDGGTDGLDVLRRIIRDAGDWLASGGHLLFEAARSQIPMAQQLCERAAMVPLLAREDGSGATVVICRRGSRPARNGSPGGQPRPG